MICSIMRISVLSLLRNKVLNYHKAIGNWLEFPDNLRMEAAFPPQRIQSASVRLQESFYHLVKSTLDPHNHQALNAVLKHVTLRHHHQGNLH